MRRDGFTLIELLLALAMLGLMIPLCVRVEAITSEYIYSTRLRNEATRLLENIVEKELARPAAAGDHQGWEGPFRWWVERDRNELRVGVAWSDSRREHQLEVVTLVAPP
ncbi:MAG: prepilin-type N-terminal cleavage/methylation domain-containing protein [Firmicutes bacterium]|nr:prepilin-type N-terminal cleavage/methylation domain-containing protein [Bacillota bacterium]